MLSLQTTTLFASTPPKDITLNIKFDSEPNGSFYDKPLHINKTITMSMNDKTNNIIMTQSKIVDNFPVTLVMLVKSVETNQNQVTLQFNLINYGFKQGGSVITQPRLVLTNGQTGEIAIKNAFGLKVRAKWADAA